MKSIGNALKMVSISLVLLLVLAACGNSQNAESNQSNEPAKPADQSKPAVVEKVTLKVMFQKGEGDGADPLHDWMQENVKLYKEQNDHVDFEVVANTSSDNYLTVITTKMAANDLPDIFQGWTLERMRPFAESGRIYDLSQDINAYPDWQENLPETGLDATTFDGGIYGIPLEMAVEPVFYNKKVFADNGLEVPTTYEQFLNIVDVLSAAGITPVTVPNKEPWVGSILYSTIFERIAGLDVYQKTVMDGEGSWTDEPFIEAGRYIQDLAKRGAFDSNMNSIGMEEAEIKLAEGKAGMYLQGTWSVPSMIERLGDNVGYFNFPDIAGGKGSSKSFMILPNSALSVSNNSKNKEEAIKFMKFIFSQERQLEFAKSGYLTFYKTKIAEGDIPMLNQEILDGLSEATGFMYPWDVPLGVFMGKELNNATQSIYTGIKPEVAFERLQKSADSQK